MLVKVLTGVFDPAARGLSVPGTYLALTATAAAAAFSPQPSTASAAPAAPPWKNSATCERNLHRRRAPRPGRS